MRRMSSWGPLCRKGRPRWFVWSSERVLFEEIYRLALGVVLGLVIAAPLGPIGLLCIRRTVERGLAAGFAIGLGAAMADAGFSAIAAFGVSAVLDALLGHETLLRISGGLFLLGVALHAFLKDPDPPAAAPEARDWWTAIGSGVALTVGNPVTILGITAIVVGFGGTPEGGQAAILVAGIFLGSVLWWLILCGGVALVRHRITARAVHWINVGTGVFLAALGFWALAGVAWTMLG